jgi:hypothetical protein
VTLGKFGLGWMSWGRSTRIARLCSAGLIVAAVGVAHAQEAPMKGAERAEGDQLSAEELRELRAVEEEVHDLKERVFRSKSTLQLLHELVVEKASFDAAVSIWHVNQLRSGYAVKGLRYFLDGKLIFEWSAEDGGAPPDDLEVRNQRIEAGAHKLQVTMDLQGNGGGVFNYVEDYAFQVQSAYDFEVALGSRAILHVRATKMGGVKKGYTDRPTVVYETRTEDLGEEAQAIE